MSGEHWGAPSGGPGGYPPGPAPGPYPSTLAGAPAPAGGAVLPPAVDEPDWDALLRHHESGRQRNRVLWAVGSVLAVGLLGAIVTTAVVKSRSGKDTTAAASAAPAAATASGSAPAGSSATPSAPASPSASRPAVVGPTVPGRSDQLADHSGQVVVTLGPGAGLKAVSGGSALALKGDQNSFAQSADRVVDVSRSFTVSAWVCNDPPTGYRSVISQGSGAASSFDLGRDDANGHPAWTFRVQSADGGADRTAYKVSSPSSAPPGQWTLLTGVYDAGQKTITLYVNGSPAGTARVPGVWAGPGPLQLGRDRSHNQWGGFWAGMIGHVQVWDQPLTAAQVAAVKQQGGTPDAQPAESWLV